ncbi:DUF1800 domain-containing protein [Dyadobacter psychrotolerans]|uniref:DUF1800 domain-containing protein n=1 Tax=Dyadobacter psychrotolerans TaxID=2541721 RepID=A0A4V2Z527_9BACT|nr:DUF1800 domain-containing protein [Dyadobacter psychrotolerans]TDE18578.1 DUF1800 domain-containing protein [Dyadobacter psychrotolerans]
MKDSEPDSKILHLYRRAGLSSLPETKRTLKQAIDQLFKNSEKYTPIQLISIADNISAKPIEEVLMMGEAAKETAKRERGRVERERVRDLNVAWVEMMAKDSGVLREHMSLFWHGHFACRSEDPVFVQNYINSIRKNALGNFGEMLMAVSKEAAMLQFLNNQQNRKNSPNENFAREVMELFTLGRGNYTETDVKEAARSFTGWAYNSLGEFEFREKVHDHGVKNFLGKQGAFEGTDIINFLLEQKQTAKYVTAKIYRSFVSEIENQDRINQLSEEFFKSGYNIKNLMYRIFTSEWFYEDSVKNALIKSPVELMVGIQRNLGATFNNKQSTLYIQRVLGQELFYPPNVAGWPGGRNWIDSSSLMFRMQLPNLMIGESEVKVKPKDSGDVNDKAVKQQDKNTKADVNWDRWVARFENVAVDKLPGVIAGQLLAEQPSTEVIEIVAKRAGSETDRIKQIRKITLTIMALPEYQVS